VVSVLLLVDDTAGNPVQDAVSYISTAGGPYRFAGRTDESGKALVSPGREARMAIFAKGFADWTGDLDPALPKRRITLEPGRQLLVQVLLPNREPAPEGILVAAFPPRSPASDSQLAADILRKHPGGFHGVTDSAGRACLVGLQPDTDLYVMASGAGYVSRAGTAERRGGVRIGPQLQAAEVVVDCAYAIELLLLDGKTGSPIAISHDAWGIPVTTKMLEPNVRMSLPASFEAILLGVTPSEGRPALAHQTQVYVTETCAAEIGPLELRARVPGYRPLDAVFFVPRSREGPMREIVTLEPTGVAFGSVEVEFTREGGGEDASPRGSLPAAILRLSQAGAPDLGFALRDLPGRNVLQPIPAGNYQGTVRTREGSALWPPPGQLSDVVVEEGRPFRIVVDLEAFASLRIDVLNADGSAFEEPMQLSLVRREGRRTACVIAAGVEPRYVHGLQIGAYEIQPIWPSGPRAGPGDAQSLLLEAGTTLELQFRVP
jgi:hypothetical protein